MSKQVTVRLPEELVDFIDTSIRRGEAASRAAVVSKALERERRRRIAERDAETYAATANDRDELDELAAWAAKIPLDDLD